MYPVTQEFQKNIKANIRKVYGKVQIDYTDPFLDQSIKVTASENANVSYPSQTSDGLSEPYAKIASLDGSWVLDGTYSLAPTKEEAETKQMGWWGRQLAGVDGAFAEPYPTLIMTFIPRPIAKLQVVGDYKRKEWPVDFKISLYGTNDMLLHTETVIGNTEITWSKPLDTAVTQVEKMELQITKWSHPGRQAKILELFTSIQETYEGEDILSINLLEEREAGQGSLPVGNISSNEIDIRLNNESRKFDAGNTESPLYQLLKPNRRIKAWLGVDAADRSLKTWEDLSGNGNHGQLINFDYNENSGWVGDGEKEPFGLKLDKESYVDCRNNGSLNMTDGLTIEIMCKNDERDLPISVTKGQNGRWASNSFGLRTDVFYISDKADNLNQLRGVRPQQGKFNHIICRTSQKLGKLEAYINGVKVAEMTRTIDDIKITNQNVHINTRYTGGKRDKGEVKLVRIYNRALTDEEILQNHQQGAEGKNYVKDGLVLDLSANSIVKREHVPLGTFWSGDWSAPEDKVYARTTGRDRLEFLHKTEYAPDAVRQNMSLYDLAVDVLTDAELKSDEYWIDEELKDYIIPYIALKPQTHREVLRKIAEACLGQVYCDRHGVIRVEGTKAIEEQNTVTASENANVSYPNQTVDDIDKPDGKYASLDGSWVLDGTYSLAPTPEESETKQMGWWGKQLAGADGSFVEPYPVLTVSFHERAIEAVKVAGDSARVEYPVDYTIRIYDSNGNVLSAREVTGNNQVENITPIPENPTNATKIELEIHKWSHPGRQVKILEFINTLQKLEITPEDYFRKDNPAQYKEVANYIVVKTQPVDANGEKLDGETIVAKDDQSITENGKLPFEFPNNPFVQTTEMAQEIADRLLQLYKDPRRNLSLEWRGNPALLLGNIVTVTDNRERNDYKVVRQEIRYDGALRAKLDGRRMLDVART